MPREDYAERRKKYQAYLRTTEWREKRAQALERAGHRCQVCNTDKRLDAHHRTYERFGREEADDITVLCRACHDLFHDNRKVRSETSRQMAKKRQKNRQRKKGPKPFKSLPRAGDHAQAMREMRERTAQLDAELDERLAA